MTIIDANLLLYACNADAPQHAATLHWLTDLLASGETVALPAVTVWAFVRICTNPRIWPNPLSAKQAFALLREWFTFPAVVLLHPGPRHMQLLERAVLEHNATGPLVTDAVLAALAMENGATLASTDQDFARFKQLRWLNPLA